MHCYARLRRRRGREFSVTVNSLVVPRLEQPVDAWSGVWIAEDIQLIAQGVRNRSWVEASLGSAAAGLDTLAFVSDPVSSLLQYGIAWLIEHVRPLTEALDWLAGDPATIAAHTQTWRAISASCRSIALPRAIWRAACSLRQACQGPAKKRARLASISSTEVPTASRNQRSWATRTTAASSSTR